MALLSCRPAPTPTRAWVIPQAENLTGDPEWDWLSRALPALLEESLSAVRGSRVQRVPRYLDAAGQTQGTPVHCRYWELSGRRLRFACWPEAASSEIQAECGPGEVAAAASALARQLEASSAPLQPVADDALRALAEGRYLLAAEQAPQLAVVYLDGVSALLARGEVAEARRLLELAAQQKDSLPAVVRARLDLARSTIDQDAAGQTAALQRLDALTSPDPLRLAQLASLLAAQRKLPQAIAAQEQLTALTPTNGDAWNQLGYYRAAAGDFSGAQAALARYRTVAPESPNPLDSLGEIHYAVGRFREAAHFFLEAYSKDPRFNGGQALLKAAFARQWSGDRSGAQTALEQFLQGREDAAVVRAQFRYSWGDSQAAAELEHALPQLAAGVQSAAAIQLALWRFIAGDQAGAHAYLSRAAASPPAGQIRLNAMLTSFLIQPDAPLAEWRARAEKALPGPQSAEVRTILVSLALIARQRGAEVVDDLRRRYESTSPLHDSRVRILLAESLRQASRGTEARELLRFYTIPVLAPGDAFASILLRLEHELRRQLTAEIRESGRGAFRRA